MKDIRLAKTADAQELYVYGEIGAPEWLDGITSQDVASELKAADASSPLLVRINSLGGLAYEGIAIYNLLAEWGGTVNVRVDAMAASAASLIAMAGDEIIMATGAMMNVHDPWALTIGPAAEHAKAIEELDVYADSLASIYQKKTDNDKAKIRQIMKADTTYTADQAVEAGFATQTVGDKAVAAYRDDSLLPLFGNEKRIAAWAPLLPQNPTISSRLNPMKPMGTKERDFMGMRLALTEAEIKDRIFA